MVLALLALDACSGDDNGASSADTTGPTTATVSGTVATATTSTTMTTTVTDTVSTGTNGETTTETTTSADGAPFFISFSTNVTEISDGESVVFTAIVSDPDGFDDIAGGMLFTEDGGLSYGPFISAGQEGTYSISVSWIQIDQVETIEFENFDTSRGFRAEFFDKDGHKVAKDAVITLHCEGGGACDGSCRNFQVDGENCGSCGKVCTSGCSNAICLPVYGECIASMDGYSTCTEYCQSVGAVCVPGGCDGNTFKGYDANVSCENDLVPYTFEDPCNAAQTWGPGRLVVRCCCSDTN